LERIGDLAVNLAERAELLSRSPNIVVPFDLVSIADKTQQMLRLSLDSLVNLDASTAREVCRMDDEVDQANRTTYKLVKSSLQSDPEHVEMLIAYLSVSRFLERIADHATNIAEDVIYMIEGVITRHGANAQ
jgi:phosphate transport system protein